MFRVARFDPDGSVHTGDLHLLDAPRPEGSSLWVDIESFERQTQDLLEGRGYHPLAIEDTVTFAHQPKVESYPSYLFLIVRGVDFNEISSRLETLKLACFLESDVLVTVHRAPLQSVQAVWDGLRDGSSVSRRGADHLLYRLMDELMDRYGPIVDQVAEEIEQLEEEIFESQSPEQLERVLALRRRLATLRRVMLPHRQIFNHLATPESTDWIDPEERLYFRDVFDNVLRLADAIDQQRDQLASAKDTYLSMVGQRTNDVMKVLTLFSAILLPMSVLTGLYGMNFEVMPGTGAADGFWVVLGAMAVVGCLLVAVFWRRGWF